MFAMKQAGETWTRSKREGRRRKSIEGSRGTHKKRIKWKLIDSGGAGWGGFQRKEWRERWGEEIALVPKRSSLYSFGSSSSSSSSSSFFCSRPSYLYEKRCSTSIGELHGVFSLATLPNCRRRRRATPVCQPILVSREQGAGGGPFYFFFHPPPILILQK